MVMFLLWNHKKGNEINSKKIYQNMFVPIKYRNLFQKRGHVSFRKQWKQKPAL